VHFMQLCSLSETFLRARGFSPDEMASYAAEWIEDEGEEETFPSSLGKELDGETKTDMLLFLVFSLAIKWSFRPFFLLGRQASDRVRFKPQQPSACGSLSIAVAGQVSRRVKASLYALNVLPNTKDDVIASLVT